MAASSNADRTAVVSGDMRLTTQQLSDLAHGGAAVIAGTNARHVAYVGTGGAMLPVLIFAAARAGLAFTPINYRLSAGGIHALVERLDEPLVIVDSRYGKMVNDASGRLMATNEFLAAARNNKLATEVAVFPEPYSTAIVLFTSGTTSQPKAVELTHNNLTSYVTGTVEFESAAENDTALICVPPYHIAGVIAALSNLYAGRKMVYLPNFDAQEWIRLVNAENVTTATVVPTMLDRIVAALETDGHELSSLRHLAYGGSKVGLPLVRRALELLPGVGFVNAYGLTETSSTIAVLTPDDHRLALAATTPEAARRLASVGQPVPGIEIQIRGGDGNVLGPCESGELFVRGEQVSGRYAGVGSVLDENGWFPTRDIALLDEDGYLFIGGRCDDTIIRGGENIAPAELEEVLVEHPQVRNVAVVGVEDPQWGQAIVAVVVPRPGTEPDPEELREHVRKSLRGSRTPDRVVFRDELPVTPTGKILRREIIEMLEGLRA
jgi:long-chain acyl-CoA synthetase